MKTVLPLLPQTAPSTTLEHGSPRESTSGGETFASVLDRRNPAPRESPEQPRASGGDGETDEVAEPVLSELEETGEADPDEALSAAPVPATVLPALPSLPFHLVEAPSIWWQPFVEPRGTVEADGETLIEPAKVDGFAAPLPAQNAAAFSAAPRPSLPILSAMFPVSMAQLQAQMQTQTTAVVPISPAIVPAPTPISASTLPAPALPAQGEEYFVAQPGTEAPVVALPVRAARAPRPESTPVSSDISPEQHAAASPSAIPASPQPRRGTIAVPPEEIAAQSAQGVVPDSVVSQLIALARPMTRVASGEGEESPLLDTSLPASGTPAAKGGEVMHDTAFQAAPKSRGVKSAEAVAAPVQSTDFAPGADLAPAADAAGIQPEPTQRAPLSVNRRPTDSRLETLETPIFNGPDRVIARFETAPISAVSKAEGSKPQELGPQPWSELPVAADSGLPSNFPVARPPADRVATGALTTEAPVHRAELVQIAERTAEAAVRMRALGTERVEVALQLESGDHLTIQLRIANGEVTPHFRTNSEGLRTALEQNWAQFSDRAGDRGVRMTPPVFEMGQSSSNMSDLSQQRHGSDPRHAHAQAELFPLLPRRVPPPRVIATAPREPSPAAAAGVRTYA